MAFDDFLKMELKEIKNFFVFSLGKGDNFVVIAHAKIALNRYEKT